MNKGPTILNILIFIVEWCIRKKTDSEGEGEVIKNASKKSSNNENITDKLLFFTVFLFR
jgi:hypothetical protein